MEYVDGKDTNEVGVGPPKIFGRGGMYSHPLVYYLYILF